MMKILKLYEIYCDADGCDEVEQAYADSPKEAFRLLGWKRVTTEYDEVIGKHPRHYCKGCYKSLVDAADTAS